MREKIICFFIILLILLLTMCVGVYAKYFNVNDYKVTNEWKDVTEISGNGNEKFNTIKNKYRSNVDNVGMTVMSDGSDVLRSYHGYCVDGNCNSVKGRNYRKFEIFFGR